MLSPSHKDRNLQQMVLTNLRKKFDMSARRFYYLSVIYNTFMSGKLFWKRPLRGLVENGDLNPKRLVGVNLTPSPCGFSKHVSSKKRMKPWFFVTLNIIIIHIFPENFIKFAQVVQKIWKISRSILAILSIFTDLLDFLTIPCYNKSNDVSL